MKTLLPVYAAVDPKRAAALAAALVGWYDQNQRDLPWRHTSDPYHIWVSEIMAQQTRIAALLPYYRRFTDRFPTVEALAEASEDEVLKLWEGLGYYSRARNLHRAARIVVSRYRGRLPADYKELRALPGIGDYTAGAILSISFGRRAPAVDGNVLRVFARLEDNHEDIVKPAAKASLTRFLADIMPTARTGAYTQALMELGALVCLPKRPACGQCPVAAFCRARKKGCQCELPVKSAKKEGRVETLTVLIVFDPEGRILVRQRTERLLQGLWELYLLPGERSAEEAGRHLASIGLPCSSVLPAGRASHQFTHIRWEMPGYRCRCTASTAPEGFRFVTLQQFSSLAMPTALAHFTRQVDGSRDIQLSLAGI